MEKAVTDEALEEAVKQLAGKKYWSIAHHRQCLGFPCPVTEVVVISVGKTGLPFENYTIGASSNKDAFTAILQEVEHV